MKKKVLFLSNHFITLYNFRKELIEKLLKEGHEVVISMPRIKDDVFFENLGCHIIDTPVDRRGINPLKDFMLILRYIKVIKKVDPDIIFSYTIKPNIYGSIASNILGYKQICNITGTGATFLKENFICKISKILYKISVKHAYKVFFQNTGDLNFFVNNKMIKENYDLLPGSGVNLNQYTYEDLPNTDEINFIFIGRVMKVKGIDEYLECAKAIKEKYKNTNFYIAGFIEEENYKDIINEYHNKSIVNYIGFQKDISSWIRKCHATVLPSHGGEGVPNVLLESAAMGRVLIASNINGSNDVVRDGYNGFLFEAKNAFDLVDKVEKFLNLSYDEKSRMGKNARHKVEAEFDRNIVINKYLNELISTGEHND